jgi:ATP-dependent Clp protease ATP-binding subunit ClpC
MTYAELKKKTNYLQPVFALESILSHRARVMMKNLFFVITLVLLALSSGVFLPASAQMTGLFFLSLVFFMIFVAVDAFYYSYVYEYNPAEPYIFELGEIIFYTKDNDLIGGFVKSPIGRIIIFRLGIDAETIKDYLNKRTSFVSASSVGLPISDSAFSAYLLGLYQSDKGFEHLLISHGVQAQTFVSCALWVAERQRRDDYSHRWWSLERLESIDSLGRDWAYGKAYTLMRVSTPLRFSRYQYTELHSQTIDRVELVLARSAEANILLVGDEGVAKMEVLEGLARKTLRQKTSPKLADKHFFVLDLESLGARAKDRQTFENTFTRVFVEASRAGNIVFIIPDMAGLLRLGESVGSEIVSLMSRFLASTALQVVAITDTDDFHKSIKPNRELMRHFVKIQVDEVDEHIMLQNIEDAVITLEAENGVFFSYPALEEAVQSAKRYFIDTPFIDAVTDILTESALSTRNEGKFVVEKDDILLQVQEKTGIATGEMESQEKDRLMNLETLLHERVVGQNEAISAIANAVRRSRAGIGNPDRPIGSLLFLGPTGVGKTETAKALSEIFFGPQALMLRLDMTEYSGDESLSRLIGSAGMKTSGVLSDMIRDHKYGVLLLDEFEKTSSKVLDLFLQILDEGFFTDATGHRVNARNLFIVATSNAGSQYIFDVMKAGTDLLSKREEIVEHLIDDGVFKPELLNRFDGVILFHPLLDVHLLGVAKIMLNRLAWRLKEKGMTLVINDALLNFVVTAGRDPKFGARPLNRFIQDVVEKKIADGVISGKYKANSTIEFSSADFQV